MNSGIRIYDLQKSTKQLNRPILPVLKFLSNNFTSWLAYALFASNRPNYFHIDNYLVFP